MPGDSPRPETDELDGPDPGDAGQSDEEILKDAHARLQLATEAEVEIRRLALDDLEFRAGNQWPAHIAAKRERDQKPCLTINRLPQFVQQVTNDHRQNRPAIKTSPLDQVANGDTSDVIQGLIRHIEYNSNAEVAYDTGFESAVNGGFGYWRVTTDYLGPDSFDQEIFIKRIRNPMSVFLDPYSQEPDGSDAAWGLITDDMSPEDYRAKYPQSKLSQAGADWNSYGNQAPGWVKEGGARVAEYFYKEFREETIHLLSTGETVKDADLVRRLEAAAKAGLPVGVVKSRQVKVTAIKWCIINGVEILEKTDWPGSFIPIIPTYGAELIINGKRILESVIRHAKDPQRMYNYWKSAETETIALAPRSPWVVAEGQIEGHEQIWATANTDNHAYLPYKPTTIAGQAAPPPQRQSFEPAVQAITQATMGAADDLKATTGIYDSATGAQSNEIAGVAINARAGQSQTSTFHFTDNFKRSLRHTGRILVDLIPHVYDAARAVRIIGPDGEQKVVRINQEHKNEAGEAVLYDLSVGRYDVTVDTGPSYATKREAASASMMDFSRAVPQVAQSCADLIAKNMDWPGAQEIADRLRKLLPPQLQDDPSKQAIPAQAQAQMSQMQMMIKQLSDHLNECTKVIETKKLDLEHRERVEMAKIQADIEINLAKLGTEGSIALLKHQVAELMQREKLLASSVPINAPQDFDPSQADGGNYAGVGHIGGSENLTGEASPGQPMEGN